MLCVKTRVYQTCLFLCLHIMSVVCGELWGVREETWWHHGWWQMLPVLPVSNVRNCVSKALIRQNSSLQIFPLACFYSIICGIADWWRTLGMNKDKTSVVSPMTAADTHAPSEEPTGTPRILFATSAIPYRHLERLLKVSDKYLFPNNRWHGDLKIKNLAKKPRKCAPVVRSFAKLWHQRCSWCEQTSTWFTLQFTL